jgi:HEAT repeat protein
MWKLFLGMLTLSFVAYTATAAEVEDLIKKLKSKDSDARRQAAKELSEMGPDARPAVADLVKALKDNDLFVRRFSATALGKVGPDAKAAVPALKAALGDNKKEVQQAAVEALSQMGPAGIDALLVAVKDPAKDAEVRRKAAEGLGAMGKPGRKAVKPLTEVLTGGPKGKGRAMAEGDVRLAVVNALGELATPADKAALAAVTNLTDRKERNRELRAAAVNAARKINARKED